MSTPTNNISIPEEAVEAALNRQHDIYAAAREEYRKKITKQAQEIDRLRAALREIDSITVHSGGDIHGVHPSFWEVAFKQAQDTARDALGGSDD